MKKVSGCTFQTNEPTTVLSHDSADVLHPYHTVAATARWRRMWPHHGRVFSRKRCSVDNLQKACPRYSQGQLLVYGSMSSLGNASPEMYDVSITNSMSERFGRHSLPFQAVRRSESHQEGTAAHCLSWHAVLAILRAQQVDKDSPTCDVVCIRD